MRRPQRRARQRVQQSKHARVAVLFVWACVSAEPQGACIHKKTHRRLALQWRVLEAAQQRLQRGALVELRCDVEALCQSVV